jgi:hypothetical protein
MKKNDLAAMKCEIEESERRTEKALEAAKDAARRSEDATRRSEAALLSKECGLFLKKKIDGGEITQKRMLEFAGGEITENNVCITAQAFGFSGSKAMQPR